MTTPTGQVGEPFCEFSQAFFRDGDIDFDQVLLPVWRTELCSKMAGTGVQLRQLGDLTAQAQVSVLHLQVAFGMMQACGSRSSVSPHQPTYTELGTTKPACHHHYRLIAVLPVNRLQYRLASATTWLTVIVKTIVRTNPVSPTIVCCGRIAGSSQPCHGGIDRIDMYSMGPEATFADSFLVSGRC